MVISFTVMSVDDGLLRTTVITTAPLSTTLYDDSLKDTVTAVKLQMLHYKVMLTYSYVHFNKHALFMIWLQKVPQVDNSWH